VPARRRTAALPLAVLLSAAPAGCGGGIDADAPPRHVLLISIDTLRADHMGAYGYERPTTPFLDTLAARGVVFDSHMANSNCTLNSHASMLTGLLEPAHGVRDGGREGERFALPPAARTLAEELRAAGYRTAAFTSHPLWLNADFGFDQGFDTFVTSWRPAERTVAEFLALLDEERPERSFSFLHFFDVHSDEPAGEPVLPYLSTPELIDEFAGAVPEGFTGCSERIPDACASEYLKAVSNHVDVLAPGQLEFLVGLYDAGIRKLDGDLERLFGELERRGFLADALVVVTADHGEAFMEHRRMLHSVHFDEVTRVPLFVVPPARMGLAPRRVSVLTQSTDVAPTVLELCGRPPIGQTASLVPVLRGGEVSGPREALFHSNVLIGSDAGAPFKYVRTPAQPVFFDRASDPLELVNRIAEPGYASEHAERLERIGARLDGLLSRCAAVQRVLREGAGAGPELSEEQRRELQKLGYFE